MARGRAFVAALSMVAVLVTAHGVRALTPPSIWDLAKDPSERTSWELHREVEQLLHPHLPEGLPDVLLDREAEIRYEKARELLEDAEAAKSPDVHLRFDLGVVYARLGSLEGQTDFFQHAIDVLQPALELAPDDPDATRALEAIVESYEKLDRPREEVAAAHRFLNRLGDDALRVETMMNTGEAEMRLGRLDDALDTFRSVLQICGALPNTISRNETYALTLWDLAVALDRAGDARSAVETAAKARKLNWDEPGLPGQPPQIWTGWDAIQDQVKVFFVPAWERDWYLALGNMAAAREEKNPRTAATLWAAAEEFWASYVTHAEKAREDRWLPIARVRMDRTHAQRLREEARAAKHPRGVEGGATDGEHAL